MRQGASTARIFHTASIAAADNDASIALPLLGLLDVLHEYDCAGLRRAPCIHAALRRLATDPCAISGLRCHCIDCVGTPCIRACGVRNATGVDFYHGLLAEALIGRCNISGGGSNSARILKPNEGEAFRRRACSGFREPSGILSTARLDRYKAPERKGFD